MSATDNLVTFPSPESTLEVSVTFLQSLLSQKEKEGAEPFLLVDCREEEEFDYCRIEGASLLPLSKFAELAPLALHDREKPVVVYCHHGIRSAQAASFLRGRGYHQSFSLAGGIDVWSQEIDSSVARY